MFGLSRPKRKDDYNYRELNKQKKADTKELKRLEDRRRKLQHDKSNEWEKKLQLEWDALPEKEVEKIVGDLKRYVTK